MREFFKTAGKMTSVELPQGKDGRASGTAFIVFADDAGVGKAVAMNEMTFGDSG